MLGEVTEAKRVDEWGPVCRGFQVSLPGGERGCVQDIRLGDDGVELVVETGLFVRRVLTVGGDEIEAILPASCRIILRPSGGAGSREGGGDVEAVGGIVRMPARHSSRIGAPPKRAA
jgi:hypothetical protein